MQGNSYKPSILKDSAKSNVVQGFQSSMITASCSYQNQQALLQKQQGTLNRNQIEQLSSPHNEPISQDESLFFSFNEYDQILEDRFQTPCLKRKQCQNDEDLSFGAKQPFLSSNSKNARELSKELQKLTIQSPKLSQSLFVRNDQNKNQMLKQTSPNLNLFSDITSIMISNTEEKKNRKTKGNTNPNKKIICKKASNKKNNTISTPQFRTFNAESNRKDHFTDRETQFYRQNNKALTRLQKEQQNKISQQNEYSQINQYQQEQYSFQCQNEDQFALQRIRFSSKAFILLDDQAQFKMCKIAQQENQKLNLRRRNSMIRLNEQRQNMLIIDKIQNEQLQQLNEIEKVDQMLSLLCDIVKDLQDVQTNLKWRASKSYQPGQAKMQEEQDQLFSKLRGTKRVKV